MSFYGKGLVFFLALSGAGMSSYAKAADDPLSQADRAKIQSTFGEIAQLYRDKIYRPQGHLPNRSRIAHIIDRHCTACHDPAQARVQWYIKLVPSAAKFIADEIVRAQKEIKLDSSFPGVSGDSVDAQTVPKQISTLLAIKKAVAENRMPPKLFRAAHGGVPKWERVALASWVDESVSRLRHLLPVPKNSRDRVFAFFANQSCLGCHAIGKRAASVLTLDLPSVQTLEDSPATLSMIRDAVAKGQMPPGGKADSPSAIEGTQLIDEWSAWVKLGRPGG